MNIGDRIKAKRNALDYTLEDVAKKVGVSRQTLSRYENNLQEPMISVAKNLADFFNIPVDRLTGESNIADDECYSYPIIGEVAAGYDSEAIEEETGDYEQIPTDWLRGHSRDDFFVLRVKGDSMYPEYKDGDSVLVERKTSVDSGRVAVVLYDNENATLKKVKYKYGEDWLELIPINPEYAPKRIENENLEQCRVLGEAKRIIRIVK